MTDGRIIYDEAGVEYKVFHAHDGYGIRMASLRGIRFAIISGRRSRVVPRRARELGIREVHQGVPDKLTVLKELKARYRLSAGEICCIGDDVPDLGILRAAGFSAAPAGAVEAVRDAVDYVATAGGGAGAIREVLDMILRQKGNTGT